MDPDGSGNIVPEFHPNDTVLRVVSDMARLYGHGDLSRSTGKRRDAATSHKFGYYAARVLCTPTMTLGVLADEVFSHSKLIVLESERSEGVASPITRTTLVQSRPVIEEL